MIYVQTKMHPPSKSGTICVIEGNGIWHAITVGDCIVLFFNDRYKSCTIFNKKCWRRWEALGSRRDACNRYLSCVRDVGSSEGLSLGSESVLHACEGLTRPTARAL